MDISGINKNLINNTIESTKTGAAQDAFERRLKAAMQTRDEKELKKVCREFEGIMMELVYKQMKATVPRTDLTGSDSGRDIFESMLDEKLVENAAGGQGMGLADILFKQMKRNLAYPDKSGEPDAKTQEP